MSKIANKTKNRSGSINLRLYEETDEASVVMMTESSRAIDSGSPHLDASRWRFVCTDPHAEPETHFRLAETSTGEIVGLAYRFDPPRHDGGRFRAVFVLVHPDYRQRGIGRSLFQAIADESNRELNDDGWHLATTIDDRSMAGLPFAKAMGFKPSSERLVLKRELPGKPIPEPDSDAHIEPFVGPSAYSDWARINNRAFHGVEGAAPVSVDELEKNRPDGFRPEHVRFARIGRERVGFLFVRETSKGGFIETLGVLPEYHGKGIAGALTASALAYLHERGHTNCELVVDQRNSAAQKIFNRLGFEEIATKIFLTKKFKAKD